MALIGGYSVVTQTKKPMMYEIGGYPDYLIGVDDNRTCDFYIVKINEPIPYIPVIYSSLYSATMAVRTIEEFKTLMRARKVARENS